MNKAIRNEIERIINALEDLRDDILNVADDELEAFDNMPESLQASERGELMKQNADDLCCAYDDLDNTINALNDILTTTMVKVFYFVADEGDGLYNIFSSADFDENGYYEGHEGEDGYHIEDYDVVYQSAHWDDCVRWIDEHE